MAKPTFATTGGVVLGNGDGTFQGFISTSPTRVAVAAVGDFNRRWEGGPGDAAARYPPG